MSKITQRYFSEWWTDDEKFCFQFALKFYEELELPLLDINVQFAVKETGTRKLLVVYEDVQIADEIVICDLEKLQGCFIEGTIDYNLAKTETGGQAVAVQGKLKFGNGQSYDFMGAMFVHNLQFVDLVCEDNPPVDIICDEEIEEEDVCPPASGPIVSPASFEDLFPYVEMMYWPQLPEEKYQSNFVKYEPFAKSSSSIFYQDAKNTGRSKILGAADTFLENEVPYKGYVRDPNDLDGAIASFEELLILVRADGIYCNTFEFAYEFLALSREDFITYLGSDDYRKVKEDLWQNYFALVIILGYKTQWLESLSIILIACNFFEQLAIQETQSQVTHPIATEEQLIELAHATIVLPKELFPLPSFKTSPPKPIGNRWIEPYAVGNLQLVKQRLIKYELGEIAHIVSLMPGEKKKIVNRKLDRTTNRHTEQQTSSESTNDNNEERTEDLRSEVMRTLADAVSKYHYGNLDSTYGPPTNLTVKGDWCKHKSHTSPDAKDFSSFARNVLNTASKKIAHRVNKSRSHISTQEEEDTTISVVDNRGNEAPLHGIYNWLNKIYEAQLINYGNRLILGAWIVNPSDRYQAKQQELENQKLSKPISPDKSFGLTSFKKISVINYAEICARYDISKVPLPPETSIQIAGTLESDESKLLQIPTGYQAKGANISYALSKVAPYTSVFGIIGTKNFLFDSPQTKPLSLELAKEKGGLPISAASEYELLPSGPVATPPVFRIGIDVECELDTSSNLFMEWQIKVYDKVMEAFKAQEAKYYEELNSGRNSARQENPLRQRQTVKYELQRACISLFIKHAKDLIGVDTSVVGATSPNQFDLHKSRYLQFINDAMEWNELTYAFVEEYGVDYVDSLNTGDDVYSAFMQAKAARLMIPVKPEFNHRILYFIATGQIWDGADELVPTVNGQENIFYALKKAFNSEIEIPTTIQEEWEVKLPTSMQILNQEEVSERVLNCLSNAG